jgi:hypothetical protein
VEERGYVHTRHARGVEPETLGGRLGEPRDVLGVAVSEWCLQVGEVAERGGDLRKLALHLLDGGLGLNLEDPLPRVSGVRLR